MADGNVRFSLSLSGYAAERKENAQPAAGRPHMCVSMFVCATHNGPEDTQFHARYHAITPPQTHVLLPANRRAFRSYTLVRVMWPV